MRARGFGLTGGALVALLFNVPGCGDDSVAPMGPDGSVEPGDADAVTSCGDGRIDPGEACDDANASGGDGCAADCKLVEPDFACAAPGERCVSTVVCGDGRFSGVEQCDDGNAIAGDGCDATCVVEPGWVCPVAGKRCRPAKCGDGIAVGNELCDDGSSSKGGCDSRCRPEPAYACEVTGGACQETTCNDGKREGDEACDDENNDMGDGCTPFCTIEPSCPYNGGQGGPCSSTCGDGLHFPGDPEECDDGNRTSGDGCSIDCKVEKGFECTFVVGADLPKLELPVVLRDFKMGWNVSSAAQTPQPGGHVDFENNALSRGLNLGVVLPSLGQDHKPQYAKATGGTSTTTGKASFDQWYRDVAGVSITVPQKMTFGRLPNGTYEFQDSTFFPLDGAGSGNQGLSHNFHFTSEVRYWFEYKGNEKLNFTGDDDVWVFIDKQLTIDLGGVHGAANGSVTLTNGNANITQGGVTGTKIVPLGLEVGKVYEVVVWQAERHTTQSNYRLSLSGFSQTKSSCTSICGDGYLTPDEHCDDGPGGNTGAYNQCDATCQVLGARCGDGIVQAESGEQCDDGVNLAPYGQGKCAPGCKHARFCSDGVVDSIFGEQCDDGNTADGDGCSSTCRP